MKMFRMRVLCPENTVHFGGNATRKTRSQNIRYFLNAALATILLAFWCSPGLLAQGQRHLRSLDVFEMEFASDPQIAPDGNQVVYVRNSMDIMTDRRVTRLWMISAEGSDHRPLNKDAVGESSPRWSPDGKRLAYLSRETGATQIFVRWMDSGQTAKASHLERSPSGLTWSPDRRWLAFSMHVPAPRPKLVSPPPKPAGAEWADPPMVIDRLKNRADGRGYLEYGFPHLFVLPTEGGTARQITSGSFNHSDAPVWTADSKHLVFSSNRNPDWEHEFRNSEIYTVSIETGEIRQLTSRKGPDHSPAASPDGKKIAFLGYDDRIQTYQVTNLYVMNMDGSEKQRIDLGLDRSVSEPTWSADGSGIYFRYDDRGNTKIGFTQLSGGSKVIASDLGGTSLGRPYGGGSFSVSDKGHLAFPLTRPEFPGDVAFSDGSSTRRLTRLNTDLFSQRDLGRVEEIWHKSSFDGREIQSWFVTPPDFDRSKKYPLVLEIHGGAISNYGDRFSPEMRLYAAAGYVALYSNPRGSTSYGEEFGNLLYHNYPGQDYDDLISGVDALIAKGFIDDENLFVTGGSAGGIMTAWIVGKTDRFRAAVAAKPVINWISKTLVADNYYGYQHSRYPGTPWENPEAHWKFSPLSLVANVSTPTLLMTGDADLRTPLSEAEQFYHALKLLRVETALVRIPGASHNIVARPSQLITKIAHVVAWFEKYRK